MIPSRQTDNNFRFSNHCQSSDSMLRVDQHLTNHNDKYKHRYKLLRKIIKAFENAALCDEASQMQEKILRAKEERRYLLKKLFQYQSVSDGNGGSSPRPNFTTGATSSVNFSDGGQLSANCVSDTAETTSKTKKKILVKKKLTKDIPENFKTKPKRKKISITKRLVQPIPLDSTGRPIFPIVLGGLTVHSLGEIVSDRPDFHNEHFIFPVGFCSTRVYANQTNPDQKCLYTCKISDGGDEPKFEIAPEDDNEQPIIGTSANQCHSSLLSAVNRARGLVVMDTKVCGADFFGLSHPTIQNLIQSCPGARKCLLYKWIKFEVCKVDRSNDTAIMSDNDASLNFDALRRNVIAGSSLSFNPDMKISSPMNVDNFSLRTLLTKNVASSNNKII
uniref:Transforming growth factor beta regulator 1 n=1 Tax=Strigamia maritima TaxID=126957 RepID=T1IZN3_STRMM